MRKWEAFFVAFLVCFVITGILLLWSLQLLSFGDEMLSEAYSVQTVSFLLAGFSFGLIPAIPVIYGLEKAAKGP